MQKYTAMVGMAAVSLSLSASDLGVKGINVGEALDCNALASTLSAGPSGMNTFSLDECLSSANGMLGWASSFLGGDAAYMVSLENGKAVQVMVAALDNNAATPWRYSDALTALTNKFGTPNIENSQIQNGLGNSFDQQQATWSLKGVYMTLSVHGMKLNQPNLLISGEAAIDDALENKKAKLNDL